MSCRGIKSFERIRLKLLGALWSTVATWGKLQRGLTRESYHWSPLLANDDDDDDNVDDGDAVDDNLDDVDDDDDDDDDDEDLGSLSSHRYHCQPLSPSPPVPWEGTALNFSFLRRGGILMCFYNRPIT